MTYRNPNIVLVLVNCLILIIVVDQQLVHGKHQCQKITRDVVYHRAYSTYKIDYIINTPESIKNEECYEIQTKKYDGVTNVTRQYKVNQNYETLRGIIIHYENRLTTMTRNDKPTEVQSVSMDLRPNGIFILFLCPYPGKIQRIFVGYPSFKRLNSEAHKVASEFTKTPEKFKIVQDETCLNVRALAVIPSTSEEPSTEPPTTTIPPSSTFSDEELVATRESVSTTTEIYDETVCTESEHCIFTDK